MFRMCLIWSLCSGRVTVLAAMLRAGIRAARDGGTWSAFSIDAIKNNTTKLRVFITPSCDFLKFYLVYSLRPHVRLEQFRFLLYLCEKKSNSICTSKKSIKSASKLVSVHFDGYTTAWITSIPHKFREVGVYSHHIPAKSPTEIKTSCVGAFFHA